MDGRLKRPAMTNRGVSTPIPLPRERLGEGALRSGALLTDDHQKRSGRKTPDPTSPRRGEEKKR